MSLVSSQAETVIDHSKDRTEFSSERQGIQSASNFEQFRLSLPSVEMTGVDYSTEFWSLLEVLNVARVISGFVV